MQKSDHLYSRRSWRHTGAALLVTALAAVGISTVTPAEGTPPDLAVALKAREEIEDLAYCYAAGTDAIGRGDLAKGKAIYSQCFTPDAVIQAFSPGSAPPDAPALSAVGPNDWADVVNDIFRASGYISTQHLMGNVRIHRTGPTATMTSYLQATHVLDPSTTIDLAAGTYKDEVVYTPAGFRIAKRTLFLLSFVRLESPTP